MLVGTGYARLECAAAHLKELTVANNQNQGGPDQGGQGSREQSQSGRQGQGSGNNKGGGNRPGQSDSDDGSRGKDDPNGTPNSPDTGNR
jgi:hypothetical protein